MSYLASYDSANDLAEDSAQYGFSALLLDDVLCPSASAGLMSGGRLASAGQSRKHTVNFARIAGRQPQVDSGYRPFSAPPVNVGTDESESPSPL